MTSLSRERNPDVLHQMFRDCLAQGDYAGATELWRHPVEWRAKILFSTALAMDLAQSPEPAAALDWWAQVVPEAMVRRSRARDPVERDALASEWMRQREFYLTLSRDAARTGRVDWLDELHARALLDTQPHEVVYQALRSRQAETWAWGLAHCSQRPWPAKLMSLMLEQRDEVPQVFWASLCAHMDAQAVRKFCRQALQTARAQTISISHLDHLMVAAASTLSHGSLLDMAKPFLAELPQLQRWLDAQALDEILPKAAELTPSPPRTRL